MSTRNLDPEERSLIAKLGAHASWARTTDRAARTAKARAAFEARYEKQAREMHPDADDEQIAAVAAHLRSEHLTRMRLAAAKARRAKAAAA